MADNAGATDEHRALNYLAVRYPAIYASAAEAFGRNASLTAVEVRPSPLSGVRKVVDVIFSYTNRNTDVIDKFARPRGRDRGVPVPGHQVVAMLRSLNSITGKVGPNEAAWFHSGSGTRRRSDTITTRSGGSPRGRGTFNSPSYLPTATADASRVARATTFVLTIVVVSAPGRQAKPAGRSRALGRRMTHEAAGIHGRRRARDVESPLLLEASRSSARRLRPAPLRNACNPV